VLLYPKIDIPVLCDEFFQFGKRCASIELSTTMTIKASV